MRGTDSPSQSDDPRSPEAPRWPNRGPEPGSVATRPIPRLRPIPRPAPDPDARVRSSRAQGPLSPDHRDTIVPMPAPGRRATVSRMDARVLIDGVVRQTTILIAQLATSGGVRAPLAHLANQVFLELSREIEAQGVSKQVSADMFGLALRSYRRRIQRVSASMTDRDRSLWEALLDYLGKSGVVTRSQVLQRFHRDDPELVKSVLHDVCESGLVFRLGGGRDVAYRAATSEELSQLGQRTDGLDELLWLLTYREGPLTLEELAELLPVTREDVTRCLERLAVERRVRIDDRGRYHASSVVMSPSASAGWEAGMLDHFQAVVKTLCARLRAAGDSDSGADVGGSTYTMRVWPGHPCEDEVRGALTAFRREYSALRQRVQEYNERHPLPADYDEVVIYGGQVIVEKERSDDEESDEERER